MKRILYKKRIERIRTLLPQAMAADRPSLLQKIRKAEKAIGDGDVGQDLSEWISRIEFLFSRSAELRSWRNVHKPVLKYPSDLPIMARREDIISAVKACPVVIISGETGSGKTTQIPKFCLEAGRGIGGMIGCTQPRRIAAITISHRISEELGEEPGKSVGYKIRFNDKTGKKTFIKLMTDGILLAEAHSDPHLCAYDTIIVDEAHERSLNIDFLLGILKKLLPKRKDLKLIIASATIDTEKFSKSFGNAPIVEVSGRMHPVTVRYFETLSQTVTREEETHIDMAIAAVEAIIRKNHPGDMLVFIPTEQDIRETCELLEGRSFGNVSILPLYARLSADEQKRVFAPLPRRKIIVATNVAETSITIPGIRYVVDTGLARISYYSPGTRTTSLPVVPVSRSSADQRKGRCGRVEHGICIRLFSEEDYLSRPLYTPPEILRSNLAEVILRMISQGLGDVRDFPFIDAPPKKSIQDGYDLLADLGAIEKKTSPGGFVLTKDGRLMARIPVDPRISRMLIEAKREGCLRQITVIASALSIQDPRERPAEKEEEARESRRIFEDPSSDFMTIIHIWNGYHDDAGGAKGSAKLKKFCRKYFLSFRRMREWQDIHDQIAEILIETGMIDKDVIPPEGGGPVADNTFLYQAVHKSVLAGFLSNIAVKKEKNIYKAAKEKEVMLFPGSGLFNKGGKWIVASEMIETTRRFARIAANIDPSWLEQIGKKHCRYSYLNPHWSTTRQEVMSLEQVRLFGLVIETGRLIPFSAVDPETACSVFIREALIKNGLKKPFPFVLHNRCVMEAIKDLENKFRKRDFTAGEEVIFTFYQKRLKCVFDSPSLEKAIAKAGSDHFLRMSMEDLIVRMPGSDETSLFPETISVSGNIFPLTYRFHPSEEDDGITVSIPLSVIPIIPKEPLEYLVPGLFREKVETLIKGLPREWRKKLMPITETVETVVAQTQMKDQPLINFISDILHHNLNVDIPAEAWPLSTLPPHLNMRIDITGPDGKPIRSGRTPDILCYKPGLHEKNRALAPFESEKKRWGKTGITRWDFGDLPNTITLKAKDQAEWIFYPGLEKAKSGDSVNLRLFEFHDEALASHPAGVAVLLAVFFAKELKFLKKFLSGSKELENHSVFFGGPGRMQEIILQRIINDLFKKNIRAQTVFFNYAESVSNRIRARGIEILKILSPVVESYHEARSTLDQLERSNRHNPGILNFLQLLKADLSRLVPKDFIFIYHEKRLPQLSRYIRAIVIRGQRGIVDLVKDRFRQDQITVFTTSLKDLAEGLSELSSDEKRKAVEEYFWLIQEYSVSLFAQELKTPFPVSRKKMEEKLQEIKRMT